VGRVLNKPEVWPRQEARLCVGLGRDPLPLSRGGGS
jgi:hypothetical protein